MNPPTPYRTDVPEPMGADVARFVPRPEYQPVTVRVVGVTSEVRAVIRNARTRGALVEHGLPRSLKGGRVAVEITLMQPVARSTGRAPRLSKRVRVAIAGGVVVVIGAAAYGAVLLAEWVMSHLPIVLGVGAALVLIPIAGITVTSKCQGLHCGGCQ